MTYKIVLYCFMLAVVPSAGFSGKSEDSSEELSSVYSQRSSSSLELGDISDYDDETMEAGNEGFSYWEEREFDKAEELLKKAAKARHSYSMSKYALILLNSGHLAKSQKRKQDIYEAAELILMGAMRREEIACDYVCDLDKYITKITTERDEETGQSVSKGLLETVNQASKPEIRKWLRGEFSDKNQYPKPITDALNLFFLGVLSNFKEDLMDKLEKEVIKELHNLLPSQKEQGLVGKRVTDIHGYASETLKLGKKIREKTPIYRGQSQSQCSGAYNYAYYNTRNKYPYDLDCNIRILNSAAPTQFLAEDNKFVNARAEPMAAGPVYDSLRGWKPNGKEPKKFPGAMAFVVDPYYEDAAEIFYGHPLWLVEMTHMSDPWKKIKSTVEKKYKGQWPHTEGKWDRKNPECKKRENLKKEYNKETDKYISSKNARKSTPYRLFLISIADRMNKSVVSSEDKKRVEIDLRYISAERLLKYKEVISCAEALVISYGTSRKVKWLENIIDAAKCKNISYSLDKRDSTKKFESFMFKLSRDRGILIYNISEKTSHQSQEDFELKVKRQKKERKREKEINKDTSKLSKSSEDMEDDILTLDMSKYTKKSIERKLPDLSTAKRIKITNLTTVNQSWVIPTLENNKNMDADSFSYSPKLEKPGKNLKKMDNLVKKIKKRKKGQNLSGSLEGESENLSSESSSQKNKKKFRKYSNEDSQIEEKVETIEDEEMLEDLPSSEDE